jgi:hypothetical protein
MLGKEMKYYTFIILDVTLPPLYLDDDFSLLVCNYFDVICLELFERHVQAFQLLTE